MIRLGLNIDHVATLRQQRAGLVEYPDPIRAAQICMEAGADLITVHVRGDRRHIQEADLAKLSQPFQLSKNIQPNFPINLEMAATDEMLEMALKYKPLIVCLVPEKREELTTEGGLNVFGQKENIHRVTSVLKAAGIKVSLFIEADESQVQASFDVGGDAVEFHTGHYANYKSTETVSAEYEKLERACKQAHSLKLHVHAGHGLDYENISKIKHLPFLEEVNIGHAIICESVFVGMAAAVNRMKSLLAI